MINAHQEINAGLRLFFRTSVSSIAKINPESSVLGDKTRRLTPFLIIPQIEENTSTPIESNQTSLDVIKHMQARHRKIVDFSQQDKNIDKPCKRLSLDRYECLLVWHL